MQQHGDGRYIGTGCRLDQRLRCRGHGRGFRDHSLRCGGDDYQAYVRA